MLRPGKLFYTPYVLQLVIGRPRIWYAGHVSRQTLAGASPGNQSNKEGNSMNSGYAAIGAVLGAGGVTGMYFGLKDTPNGLWIGLGVVAGVVIVSYIVATFTANNGFGEAVRGWLIGINSAANGVLGALVYGKLFGDIGGLGIGIAIGLALLNFLCTFPPITQVGVYQGLIGYLNWLMPMSWVVTGLGFVFYLLNVLGWLFIGLPGADYFKIKDVAADWKTGTFFMKGGWISNLNPIDTAFNMGNFAFVDKNSGGTWHKEHEAGHTLNLFAFGWVFHFVGAIEENATSAGANAYSERLAESNDSGTGGNNIPMWA